MAVLNQGWVIGCTTDHSTSLQNVTRTRQLVQWLHSVHVVKINVYKLGYWHDIMALRLGKLSGYQMSKLVMQ